ncbi:MULTISPECIES: ribosome small subunit-dependent GTPase A [unclassified Streptomyces]|uniref:ribosome small subunit-dependent GTPase A n=1 Tax=unclassified Streptomyces TaxID=2593676 RepID=UPI00225059AA|nr:MULTISPECIES: ribosome small subunit-dependent GTPase A [unclassified Streptomyces]WSP58411.1 ribosome small subunit-dependent GTPase A [Streptomyces sp. NBC_01241]WSU21015.1 ribosome small subunit-dependent GTPase A [Streptomyces sp. NBC_01108]MCX4790168.1 ribosome small subunit-dependent GTPase A [Streptomyces sp. NBC_01221]MCX4794104.1 ribosome small subunit-dependent GTPase A [Streptomyces sp. NBC_01242]WSJ35506.1 ribosome small subunit-dependent GTPase A [Streptomyces sp. NBC_01321]
MSFPSSSSLSSSLQGASVSHPLSPYGWDDDWAAAFAPYAEQGLLPGRVVRVDRGQCDVVTPYGTLRADTAFVVPRDPMRIVCTGDWVAVDPDGDPQFVRTLLPRRTAFVRSTSSQRSEGQVLATNVDHIAICVSLAVELDLGRVERFLALAMSSSGGDALLRDGASAADGAAQPIVVLTKADLVPDTATLAYLVQDVEAIAPGVQVLTVSSATGEGLDVFAAIVSGGTSVLLGASGAGKSTLANTLLGRDVMEVQAARDVDGKGRHTTTTRNLLVLPSGGVLIDTPGLRGVGLWDAETGVGQLFSEIEELAERCRFQDCAHLSEPGCAVLAAVEDGSLPERRLDSFRKLLRENQRIVAKTDARVRSEMLREWKRKGAEGRAAMDAKRGRLR